MMAQAWNRYCPDMVVEYRGRFVALEIDAHPVSQRRVLLERFNL
ncbi:MULTISPECIES: hypothetical protein [Sphingomonadaceae]|nr:hypothetical protein [Hephaestia caeni]